MANTYFQFKQFTVHQDKAAMKVSTDACLQGAVAAQYWQEKKPGDILDIGSGTGLLSLMLAQHLTQSKITAIDIEEQAFIQTSDNFAQSPWQQRLQALHSSLQSFGKDTAFDAIICNPPFFHKHLNSQENNRNMARHDEGLNKTVLAKSIRDLLHESGSCCLLYPATEWAAWNLAASEQELYPEHTVYIQPYEHKAANRVIGFFSRHKQAAPTTAQLTIYADTGKTYTPQFIALLQAYYMNL